MSARTCSFYRRKLWLKCLESRVVPTISWMPQGPGPIIDGQVEGMAAQNNPVSGAVSSVLPHPTDVNTLYVGTTNGGVWKTTNATNVSPTWTPLTDAMASQSILELVFDPTDASSQTVLAGIGRSSSFGLDGAAETGILRSADGGATWTTLGTTTLANVKVNGIAERGSLIVVSAASSNNPGGVWRSTDRGLTFTLISGTGGLPAGSGFDMVEDPSNPMRLYVATTGGIFRSADFGITWTAVTPPGSGITTATDNVKIAVHSNGPNNAVYVGVVASRRLTGIFRSGDLGGNWQAMDIPEVVETATTPITGASNANPIVITSNNHGQQTGDRVLISNATGNTAANGTWTLTRLGNNTFSLNGSVGNGAYGGGGVWQAIQGLQPVRAVNGAPAFRNPNDVPPAGQPYNTAHVAEPPGGQGSIHFSMAADPTNSQLVYLGGDRQPLSRGSNTGNFPNAIGAFNFSGRLFRGNAAAASGSQWTPLTHNFTNNSSSPHADSRDMAFDAAGNLIEGDDGGPYKRTNPSSTAGGWVALHGTLANNEVYPGGVAYDPLNNVYTAGAQDTGSFMQSKAGGAEWFQTNQGDGGAAAAAVIGGNSVRYHSAQFLGGFTRRTFNSSNVEISAAFVGLNVTGGGGPTGFLEDVDSLQFVTPIELNRVTPTRMAIASDNYVYESTNQGNSLTRLNFGLEAGFVRSLAYGATGNPDLIWFGGNNGATQLMIRTTAGGAFTLVSTFPGFFTKDIAIDTASATTAFIVDFNDGIFRTTDNGATAGNWTNLTGNLNTAFPGDVRSVTAVPGFLVVGKLTGVFAMRNSAPGVWFRVGGALPTVPVNDVRYDATDNLLYAGTLGRGVWSFPNVTTELAEVAAPTAAITPVVPDPISTPVNTLTVVFNEPVNGLDLADFSFKRGGTPLTLNPGTQTLSTTDFKSWTIGNLSTLTSVSGVYTLDLPAATAGVFDGAGNKLSNSPTETFTVTSGAPFVQNISSTLANGIYLPNVAVSVDITFDQAVTVTGTPTLTLETGAIDAVANFVSGSGSSVLTFTFTTAHGFISPDLDYTSTTALALAGGSIKSGGTAASLTLPAPGSAGSLGGNKNIILQPRATISGYTPVSVAGSTLSQIMIQFAQAMDTTSFSFAADVVSFTGPPGNLVPALTGFSWPTATTLRITFAPQTASGSYALVLGPQILSLSGSNPLDQDADNNPGEPVDDRFTAAVTLTALTVSEASDIDDGNTGPGKLSLREAVNIANGTAGTDAINFDPMVFGVGTTITLTKGVLTLSDGVSIVGPGTGNLTLNGGGTSRIFFVNATGSGNPVSLSGMRLTNGNSGASNHGGAIYNEDEALTLTDMLIEGNTGIVTGGGIRLQATAASLKATNSIIRNNVVATGTGLDVGDGGGISIRGDSVVTLTDCTVSGNTADDDGAGIYFFADGTLTLTNSTVSGNTAKTGDGGGVYGYRTDVVLLNSTLSGNSAAGSGGGVVLFSSSTLTARNSTLAFNTAGAAGGGIAQVGGSVTLESTIVAMNKNGNNGSPDISGKAAATNSLIGITLGATITGAANKLDVDPLLSALTGNGGPTSTHALSTGSPAINAGLNTQSLATDQRGSGFVRVIGTAADIGAFELQSTFIVTTTADSGAGSLRAALAAANANPGADTITFDAGVFASAQTITLTTGQLNITDALTISGPSAKLVTVSGNNASRVFNIDIVGAGISVSISSLTIAGGLADNGGGILLRDDALTLTDCAIMGNKATVNDGGGVHVSGSGSLTVRSSTLSGNTAVFGAAIDFYSAGGTLTVENSTLSGNSSSSVGGAIYFSGAAGTGVFIRNSTITGNTGTAGGGIFRTGNGTTGITLTSTIVSGNVGGASPDISSPGTVTVNFSAIGANAGFTLTGANNLPFGADLKLAALAHNGGSTLTHALQADSAAIDTGSNPAPTLTFDQRGNGFPRVQGTAPDIGAFEALPIFVVKTTADSGAGSLRAVLAAANAFHGPDTVTFDPVVFATAQTITLTTGQVDITDAVTITGPGAKLATVSGNGASRVFNIDIASAGAAVTVSGLTITGGVASNGGGILVQDDALTLIDSAIVANTATGSDGGGVHVASGGSLTIRGSTFSANIAQWGGAIDFYNGGGTLSLENSTLSGNSAANTGGGIYFAGSAGAGIAIRNSTITGNTAGSGGGIYRASVGSLGVTITSSIVSGNIGGGSPDIFNTSLTAVNFSAIGANAGFTLTGANNLAFGADLKLGLLAFNGGSTKTHALLAGSPAVSTGSNPAPPLDFDQRGAGFPRLIGSKLDIGAVEAPPAAVTTFVVNDGAVQRSRLSKVVVNFAAPVDAEQFQAAGAVFFTRTGIPTVGLEVIGTIVNNTNGLVIAPASGLVSSITLTFANINNAGIDFGSLSDGRWQMSIVPAGYTSPNTLADTQLRRLFGNVNNDTITDGTDIGFYPPLGMIVGSAFDFNNNNDLDGNDLAEFGNRFGITLI